MVKVILFFVGIIVTSSLQAVVPLIHGDGPFNPDEQEAICHVVGMTHPYRQYTPEELATPAVARLLSEAPDAVEVYIREELGRLLPARADIRVRVIPSTLWELFAMHEALEQGRLGKIRFFWGEERPLPHDEVSRTVGKRDFSFKDFLDLSQVLYPLLPVDPTPESYKAFAIEILAPRLESPIPPTSQLNILLPNPLEREYYAESLSRAKLAIAKDIRQHDDSFILAVLLKECEAMMRNRVLMLRATHGVTVTKEALTPSLLDFPLPYRKDHSLTEEMGTLALNIAQQKPTLVQKSGPEKLQVRECSFGTTLFAGFIHDGLGLGDDFSACVWEFVRHRNYLFYLLSLPRQELLSWGNFFSWVLPDWSTALNGRGELFHIHFPACWFRENQSASGIDRDACLLPDLPVFDPSLPLPQICLDPEKQKGAEQIFKYMEAFARLLARGAEIISIGPDLVSRSPDAAVQAARILEEQRRAHGALRDMLREAAALHPR